jgi:hypothetical protein
MLVRYALCLIGVATSALAEWTRHVTMPHGAFSDSPPAHSLAYFRAHPCARSDPKDRFLQCNQHPSAAELARQLRMQAKVRRVGKVGTFTIYDLEYFFDGDELGPGLKSVLVQTAPNQLHEIRVQGNQPQGTFFPTEILAVGQQLLVKVKWDDGGNYHIVYEDYFAILKSGALLLDFKPVFQAASEVTPSDMITYQPMSHYDFKSLVFNIATEKRDVVGRKVACCQGRVEVPFRIDQGRVVVGEAKYFPD